MASQSKILEDLTFRQLTGGPQSRHKHTFTNKIGIPMKKLLFAFAIAAFAISAVSAQDGEKGLKDATRNFNTYKLDPSNNRAKLLEALSAIDVAAADPVTAAQLKTWQLRGDIYNEVATQKINASQFAAQGLPIGDVSGLDAIEHPGLEAAKSFTKALGMAVKKFEIKDALNGMKALQNNLQNLGIIQYEKQDFKSAFHSFAACLDMHDQLAKNKEQSMFSDPAKYEDQLFYVGLAGASANMGAESKPYFLKLYEMKAQKPAIYEALYSIEANQTSPEEAYKYLEEGRKQFPDEVSLLFAEINHYLRIGKLDELITRIESAIQMEPNNVSLYTTMGSVYDNLYQKEFTAGNRDKAEQYAAKALDYFNQALSKDANNFDALYSIGALYYNKAAAMTQDLNKLADDYSKAGLEKYKAKQKEVLSQFDLALPYFQRCEKANPNDSNTLIALKEIYAKKDDLDLSNEFKNRLEKVQNGEKNTSPYFKN